MEKRELVYYRLDKIDGLILDILQANARASLKDIAEQVFLSPTAVGARIDRMLQEGVLEGFTTRLNPEAMGHYIKAFINLEVTPDQKEEFITYINDVLNVVECNCVTGDYSMLIEVRFPTTSDLDQFIGELQKFGKTKTQIVFSTCVKHRCRYWKVDGRDFASHASAGEVEMPEMAEETPATKKSSSKKGTTKNS